MSKFARSYKQSGYMEEECRLKIEEFGIGKKKGSSSCKAFEDACVCFMYWCGKNSVCWLVFLLIQFGCDLYSASERPSVFFGYSVWL